MPRYYFHINELDTDPEGTELPDLAAARQEVMLAARELLAAIIVAGREDVPFRFLITDGDGQVLDTVLMKEILPKALLNDKDGTD